MDGHTILPLPADFEVVSDLVYTHRKPKQIEEDAVMTCACRQAKRSSRKGAVEDGAICFDESCENFSVRTECLIGFCSKGRCKNQRLQRKQFKQVAIIDAGPKGRGMVPTEFIARGSLILEYTGEVINEGEQARRLDEYASKGARHFYLMGLGRGEYVDAARKGSVARFINHSCEPNSAVELWTVGDESRVAVFAQRDIPVGTEITIDYGWERATKKTACYCGAASCKGFIGGKGTDTDSGAGGKDGGVHIPPGRFREPTPEERSSGAALVGAWVQVLWEGDAGLKADAGDESDSDDDSDSDGSDNEGGGGRGRGKKPSPIVTKAARRSKHMARLTSRRLLAVVPEGCWYTGRVTSFSSESGRHTVRYSADGQVCPEEHLGGPAMRWRILQKVTSRAEAVALQRQLREERLRARAEVASPTKDGPDSNNNNNNNNGNSGVNGDGGDDDDDHSSVELEDELGEAALASYQFYDDFGGAGGKGTGGAAGGKGAAHAGASDGAPKPSAAESKPRAIVSSAVVPRRRSLAAPAGSPTDAAAEGASSSSAGVLSAYPDAGASQQLLSPAASVGVPPMGSEPSPGVTAGGGWNSVGYAQQLQAQQAQVQMMQMMPQPFLAPYMPAAVNQLGSLMQAERELAARVAAEESNRRREAEQATALAAATVRAKEQNEYERALTENYRAQKAAREAAAAASAAAAPGQALTGAGASASGSKRLRDGEDIGDRSRVKPLGLSGLSSGSSSGKRVPSSSSDKRGASSSDSERRKAKEREREKRRAEKRKRKMASAAAAAAKRASSQSRFSAPPMEVEPSELGTHGGLRFPFQHVWTGPPGGVQDAAAVLALAVPESYAAPAATLAGDASIADADAVTALVILARANKASSTSSSSVGSLFESFDASTLSSAAARLAREGFAACDGELAAPCFALLRALRFQLPLGDAGSALFTADASVPSLVTELAAPLYAGFAYRLRKGRGLGEAATKATVAAAASASLAAVAPGAASSSTGDAHTLSLLALTLLRRSLASQPAVVTSFSPMALAAGAVYSACAVVAGALPPHAAPTSSSTSSGSGPSSGAAPEVLSRLCFPSVLFAGKPSADPASSSAEATSVPFSFDYEAGALRHAWVGGLRRLGEDYRDRLVLQTAAAVDALQPHTDAAVAAVSSEPGAPGSLLEGLRRCLTKLVKPRTAPLPAPAPALLDAGAASNAVETLCRRAGYRVVERLGGDEAAEPAGDSAERDSELIVEYVPRKAAAPAADAMEVDGEDEDDDDDEGEDGEEPLTFSVIPQTSPSAAARTLSVAARLHALRDPKLEKELHELRKTAKAKAGAADHKARKAAADAAASPSAPTIPLAGDTWFGEEPAVAAMGLYTRDTHLDANGGKRRERHDWGAPSTCAAPRYPHILLPARLLLLEPEAADEPSPAAASGDDMDVAMELSSPQPAAASARSQLPHLAVAYEHCAHDLGGLLEVGATGLCDPAALQRLAYQLLRGLSRAAERDVVLGAPGAGGGVAPRCVRVTSDGIVRLGGLEHAVVVSDRLAAKATAACGGPSTSESRHALARQLEKHARAALLPSSPAASPLPSCGYTSPEVLLGCPAPLPASDGWSAGCLLFALFTGQHLFAPGAASAAGGEEEDGGFGPGSGPRPDRVAAAAIAHLRTTPGAAGLSQSELARRGNVVSCVASIEAVCGSLGELWPLSAAMPHSEWVRATLTALRSAGAVQPAAPTGGANTHARLGAYLTGLGLHPQQVALLTALLTAAPSARCSAREALSQPYFKEPAGFVSKRLDADMLEALAACMGHVLLAGGGTAGGSVGAGASISTSGGSGLSWYVPGAFPALKPCVSGAPHTSDGPSAESGSA